MQVRAMRAGEGPQLRELRLRALRDAPEAFHATADGDAARPMSDWEDLARGPGVVLIAGDWAGMAGIFIDEHRPMLWGMWVAPEHRRSGVGRALLDAAADWARARGYDVLALEVFESAPGARALYEAAGFRPASGWGMELALRPPQSQPRRLK